MCEKIPEAVMRDSHGFIMPEFQNEHTPVAFPRTGWPGPGAHIFITLHRVCSRSKQRLAKSIGQRGISR